jgi:hypothetical protein
MLGALALSVARAIPAGSVSVLCCSCAVPSTQKRVRSRTWPTPPRPPCGLAEASPLRRLPAVLRGEQEHRQGWSLVCYPSVLRRARAPSEVSHPKYCAELSVGRRVGSGPWWRRTHGRAWLARGGCAPQSRLRLAWVWHSQWGSVRITHENGSYRDLFRGARASPCLARVGE